MDDADRAAIEIENSLAAAILQRKAAPALRAKGKCHFCNETVDGERLFCDNYCADDHRHEEEALKRAGRR